MKTIPYSPRAPKAPARDFFRPSAPCTPNEAVLKTKRFFAERGIRPTLKEYREVYACMQDGSNPLGIH